jgi:hypothetical protein
MLCTFPQLLQQATALPASSSCTCWAGVAPLLLLLLLLLCITPSLQLAVQLRQGCLAWR